MLTMISLCVLYSENGCNRDDDDHSEPAAPRTWAALAECVQDADLPVALAKAIRDATAPLSPSCSTECDTAQHQ